MRIYFGILLMLFGWVLKAQDSNSDLDLYLEAQWNGTDMEVYWVPTNADLWKAGWKKGYTIERKMYALQYDKEIYEDRGQLVFDTIPYENSTFDNFPVSPVFSSKGDSAWFANNKSIGNGYGERIDAFLNTGAYDSYSKPLSKDQFVETQFQHAQFAAKFFPEMNLGLEQGFLDTYVDTFSNNSFVVFEYTISMKDTVGVSGTVRAVPSLSAPKAKNSQSYVFQTNLVDFEVLQEAPRQMDRIASAARAYEDSIVVRWAPLEGHTWVKSLEEGFRIVKFEVPNISIEQIENDPSFDFSKLRGTPVDTNYVSKWDSATFEKYMDIDSNILVTAMAIYGDFKKDARNQKEYADALRNKYGYALYAAELSGNAANSMGLRFVDYKVTPGKKYRYEVTFTNRKTSFVKSQVEVLNQYEPLPKPFGFESSSGEYLIGLSLDRFKNEANFSFYFFEKSEDGGGTWKPVNNGPLAFSFDRQTEEVAEVFTITDSVPELYRKYQYRVRALNPFNEYSDWIELEEMAVDLTPPDPPFINEPQQISATSVAISWEEVSSLASPDLDGYIVKLGGTDPASAKKISELLPTGTNTFVYSEEFRMDKPYFFSVVSVDTAGNEASSVPVKLTVIDSIPPDPPVDLVGKIDTNGYVTLFWPHNKEPDLFGYRVYFANDSTSEFTQLTSNDIQFNYFNDTIPLKALSEEVYYQVQAVDARFNRSDLSNILVLKRPDIIPPAAPILLSPVSNDQGVQLEWRPSSSTDVVHYFLYRREVNAEDSAWALLDSIIVDSIGYMDASADFEVMYEYTLSAKDDADLFSPTCLPVRGRRFFPKGLEGVSVLKVSVEREQRLMILNWSFEKPKDEFLQGKEYRFVVYRGENKAPLQRYRVLKSLDPEYRDKNIKNDIIYKYAIGVVYEDGKKTTLSPEAYGRIKSE